MGAKVNRHREAGETEDSRRIKKLVGKTSWYKTRRGTVDRQPSNTDRHERQKNVPRDRPTTTIEKRPDTVMFVERTAGGALITALRAQERELNKFTSKKGQAGGEKRTTGPGTLNRPRLMGRHSMWKGRLPPMY